MTVKENMKLPEYYFCLNDMISSREVEECIIEECESAGLEIIEDEDLAEDRGYDRAFEVSNPYKDKLKKVLEICKTNANKNWEDDFENKAEDEFNEIVKIIERNDNE